MKKTVLLFLLLIIAKVGFAQETEWISYCDGTPQTENAFSDGTNTNFDIAIKYSVEDLQSLNISKVHAVQAFHRSGGGPPYGLTSCSAIVWQSSGSSEVELVNQSFSPSLGAWAEITFDSPVTIDPTKDLYVGIRYSIQSTQFNYVGIDAKLDNPGKGNLIRMGGDKSAWEEVEDMYNQFGDWCINVSVEYGEEAEEFVISYGDGTYGNFLNNAGLIYDIANYYTSADIKNLGFTCITSVDVYGTASANPTGVYSTVVMIIQDNVTVASKSYTHVRDDWATIEFDSPVEINQEKDLYITVRYETGNKGWGFATCDPTLNHPGKGNLYRVVEGGTPGNWQESFTGMGDWNIKATVKKSCGLPKYSLSFNVVDEKNNPISDAIVTLNDETYASGIYQFTDLLEADYTYTINKAGYYQAGGKLTLSENTTVNATLHLIPQDTYLNVLHRGKIAESGEPMGIYYHNGIYHVALWDLAEEGNERGKVYLYEANGNGIAKAEINGKSEITFEGIPNNNTQGGEQNFMTFTSDGTYVYAVNLSNYIYVLDPNTYKLVKTIQISGGRGFAAIAYDYEKKGFWCTDSEAITAYFVEMDGTVTSTILSTGETSGSILMIDLTYDDISEGGPYLWNSVNGPTYEANVARIGRWQIETGVYEPYILNVKEFTGFYPIDGSYMGGIDAFMDYNLNKYLMAGIYSSQSALFAFELDEIAPANTPRRVTDVSSSVSKENGTNITLSWTNPTKTVDRQTLTSLQNIKIYRNGELIHTIASPTVGGKLTWTDSEVYAQGLYTYTITASNENGEGMKTICDFFGGEDVPAAPSNVNVEIIDSQYPKITWTAPTIGKNNGWIETSTLRYKITRMPDNVVLADNLTETSYIDNSIVVQDQYHYLVTAITDAGEGGTAASEEFVLGNIMTVPWVESFSNASRVKALWTVINVGEDNYKWTHNPYGGVSADGVMQCISFDVARNDDWLISPYVSLEAGVEYLLRYYVSAETESNELYEVTLGNGITVESQTRVLKTFTEPVEGFNIQDIIFSVTETGDYTLAWHSIAGGEYSTVIIDNIQLTIMPDVDIAVSNISFDAETLLAGDTEKIKVSVRNDGRLEAKDFQVNLWYQLNNDDTKVLIAPSPYTYTSTLTAGASAVIEFNFTPATKGIYNFHASAELNGDANIENNNFASTSSLEVFPAGTITKYIGDPASTTSSQLAPINLYYLNGAAQALYWEDGFGLNGKPVAISSLEYYYSFEPDTQIGERDLKIYMTTTKWNDMYEGWISADTVLVYDGPINLPLDQRKITIPLQQPYLYFGDNLVVFTSNQNQTSSNPLNQFKVTRQGDNDLVLRAYADNATPFSFEQTGRMTNVLPNTLFVMNDRGASLSGTVKDQSGNPLADVKVNIEGKYWSATTDANGNYSFPFIPADDAAYLVTAQLSGYNLAEAQTVAIDTENKTCNFVMNSLPKTKVTGKVTSGAQMIEGANIILTGSNDKHTTVSIAGGTFSFGDDIYYGTYTINVYAAGCIYYSTTQTFDSAESVINIDLTPCTSNPARTFKTVTNNLDWYKIRMTWTQPSGVNAQKYVDAYNIYIDGQFVSQEQATSRLFIYDVKVAGEYVCEISAIWNDGCESERVSSTIKIEADPGEKAINTFPFKEGFETGTLESYWKTKYLNGNDIPWTVVDEIVTPRGETFYPYNGNYAACLVEYFTVSNVTRLISPKMDITGLANPTFSLNYFNAVGQWPGYINDLSIYYKNSPDAEWTFLALYPVDIYEVEMWRLINVSLPDPSETYWIALEGYTYFGYGLLIDDISVQSGSLTGIETPVDTTADVQIILDETAEEVTVSGENMKLLNVYNSLGQLVKTIDLTSTDKQTVDVSNYQPGIYVFNVITGDAQAVSKKFALK